jgi:hypothetical protein
MEPRNRFQGINSASLYSRAGRYDNPIPTRCLAPIDFLKHSSSAFRRQEGARNGVSHYSCTSGKKDGLVKFQRRYKSIDFLNLFLLYKIGDGNYEHGPPEFVNLEEGLGDGFDGIVTVETPVLIFLVNHTTQVKVKHK